MSVALVTNYLPGYRLPLYELLAERNEVEVHCFGGEGGYVPESMRDLKAQLALAPFPAYLLARQRDALQLGTRHRAVIAAVTGRVALPAAYLGARRAGRPFLLWASLWRHPRTVAHLASLPIMRHLYRRADAVLTYGPHVSGYVAQRRGSVDGVFEAVQAVERELFARPVTREEKARWRASLGVSERAPLVLFVGRLVREKGVGVLLEAWSRLAERSFARLCLVGDGPLRAPSPPEGVHFAGRLRREELPVAYAAADVVVVPSVRTAAFLEPWGLVCNEAMNQGCPVIATSDVGAVAGGLVRDGDTGIVVPAGDARALADAIDRLLHDDRLRGRLSAAARNRVAGYTYERAAEAFTAALRFAGVS